MTYIVHVTVECRLWQQQPLLSIVYMLVQLMFVRIQEFQSDVQKEGEISKVAQEFSETVTDPKIQATEVCVIVSGHIVFYSINTLAIYM